MDLGITTSMRWQGRWAVVALAVLLLAGCGTPRVDVFDAVTAPSASQAGSVIAIHRIARTWGRIELDLSLDASATAQVYRAIVPQVTSVTLYQAGTMPTRVAGSEGRAQRIEGLRNHTPTQMTRLPDNTAITFRVIFEAAGIDDSSDLVLVVTGALCDHPLLWRLCVPALHLSGEAAP